MAVAACGWFEAAEAGPSGADDGRYGNARSLVIVLFDRSQPGPGWLTVGSSPLDSVTLEYAGISVGVIDASDQNGF